jgi:transcriptional regulator with XRE-family HTH domain
MSTALPTLLRAIRFKLALTLEQLAARLGVSSTTVNGWESSETKPERAAFEAIITLAIATGVEIEICSMDTNSPVPVTAMKKRTASNDSNPDGSEAQLRDSFAILKPSEFEPATLCEMSFPVLFSLGEIHLGDTKIAAACPILWRESIYFDGAYSQMTVTDRLIESAAIQIFAQATDRVQIVFFDSSLESSTSALEAAACLLNAKSKQERISIFRTAKDFDEQFARLTSLAKNRKSRLAIEGRNDWAQIFEQDTASTFILLVISNPYELYDRPAFERLAEFLRTAPRLGINTWIKGTVNNQTIDCHKKIRAEEWVLQIKEACHVEFEISGNTVTPTPKLRQLQPFSTYCELGAIHATSIGYDAERAFLDSLNLKFSTGHFSDAHDFISVEIGKRNGQPLLLGFGPRSGVYHSILAGATGSGKTVFLKLLLTLICEKYTSREVQIHLYDFKGGANLNFYRGIPNFINLFECRKDPSRALQAMDLFLKEADRRQELFNQAQTLGMVGEDLSAYNKWASSKGEIVLPVHFLIIDELGQLYDDFRNEKSNSFQLKMDFNRKINQTARQGRSQGMFLLLSSQHFDDMEIDAAIANTQLRMSMRLDKRSQCTKIFESGNTAAYDFLSKVDASSPRDIIINTDSGRSHANQVVRLPFVTHESLTPRLAYLKGRPANHAHLTEDDREPGSSRPADSGQAEPPPCTVEIASQNIEKPHAGADARKRNQKISEASSNQNTVLRGPQGEVTVRTATTAIFPNLGTLPEIP